MSPVRIALYAASAVTVAFLVFVVVRNALRLKQRIREFREEQEVTEQEVTEQDPYAALAEIESLRNTKRRNG